MPKLSKLATVIAVLLCFGSASLAAPAIATDEPDETQIGQDVSNNGPVAGADVEDSPPTGEIDESGINGGEDVPPPTAPPDDDQQETGGCTCPDDGNTPETPEHDDAPGEPSDNALTLDNAQFRWGVNALQHQRPHFGRNFLSAGKLPVLNPQQTSLGAEEWSKKNWKQTVGSTRIERASGTRYVPASWDGFTQWVDHQVVMDGGQGRVDPDTQSADIRWSGSFTVAKYSGMTFFYVSDPRLTVHNGIGKITATLGGYSVARPGDDDPSAVPDAPEPLPDTEVTLLELGRVSLDSKDGLSMKPLYQGSFPSSFMTFIAQVGQTEFWSKSGSDDAAKAPSTVFISFNSRRPVTVTPPKPVKKPKTVTNKTKEPDNKASATPPVSPVVPVQTNGLPSINTPPAGPPKAGIAASAPYQLVSLGLVRAERSSSNRALWFTGFGLFGGALITLLIPSLFAREKAS